MMKAAYEVVTRRRLADRCVNVLYKACLAHGYTSVSAASGVGITTLYSVTLHKKRIVQRGIYRKIRDYFSSLGVVWNEGLYTED